MNKFLSQASTIILGIVLVASCSSGGGGGGSNDNGTGGGGPATVPSNAITIDNANAESTILSVASLSDTFDAALGVQTTSIVGLKTVLKVINPLIKTRSNSSGIDFASGVDINEGGACSGGGTFSFIGTETDDGNLFTESATANFNNCSESGFTIDGNLTAFYTEDSSGNYSDDVTGFLSIIIDGQESITLSMTGIDLKETGNYFTGNYETTSLTFAIDFVSSGNGSGGFLVELTAPIVETNGDQCPESGTIRVTGANGTFAEGTFNGDGATLTINANGTIVNSSASCV